MFVLLLPVICHAMLGNQERLTFTRSGISCHRTRFLTVKKPAILIRYALCIEGKLSGMEEQINAILARLTEEGAVQNDNP